MSVFNLLKNRIEEMEERGDVDGLIHALNDDAENVRREAVMALERIGDTRATEPLIQALQDPDKTIQEEVITALGRIQDKKAVPPLIKTLNNQHIGIRWRAAEALGKIGDPQATEPLIQTLQDPDKTIQEEVITALGRIAVNPLIHDLKGEDQNVRKEAIIALNHLREFKVTEQEELSKQVESESDKEMMMEDLNKEVPKKIKTDTKGIDEETTIFESAEKPDFNVKRKNLVKNGYHIYIVNFVKNSRYNYLDGFSRKSRYDYEFLDIRKLGELLKYKGMDFSDEEVLWLIQEEIKNQEYLEFKEKILAQNPENITEYLEILIKTYKEPKDQKKHLKTLLKQQNIPHKQNLTEEIEKTQKQIEITEFENKILNKKVSETVLPVDMEDLDEAYISYNLGNLFYELGKLEKALSHYDRALYIYPEFIDAWKNSGLMYYTLGRLQKAAACYNQILHLDPEYPELWVDIGIIFFEMGRVEEAKDCYEKAMEMNPCYQSEDLAVETRKFLENRPISLKKFDSYLELASSAWWESSDPTPPLSRIMQLVNKNYKD
jgi:tetratricopeptide (TPR) repeat protein